MDKKTVNEVVDSLKEEAATIGDPQIKKIFTGLFNLVELLAGENEKLTVENQQLKNEINELKGEQGKPDVKPNKRNATDISSEQERKNGKPGVNGEDDKASGDNSKKSAIANLNYLILKLTEITNARLINLLCRQM